MQNSAFSGIVKDTDGNFLAGVSVTTGTESATTNSAGLFTFDRVGTVKNRSVLKFTKDGYFTVTRSEVKQSESSIEVVMQPKGNSNISVSTNFNSNTAKTLSVKGMKVAIPASSLTTTDGSAYTGNVNADMLYLDPNNENFATMMPGGDMQATRTDNSAATLISYGMVEVSLTDDSGNPLQLNKDGESEMTYPIPAGMENNPPATIPLWFFDEERGLWTEEGTATLKGGVYVGKVKHFSWHNLDVPEERVTIKGKITDCNGNPVSNVKVTVDQTCDMTDANGNYEVFVPANTPVTVTVLSGDYNGYSPEVAAAVPGQAGGATVTQNLQLPCLPFVSGKVTNACATLVAAYVWLEYTSGGKLQKTNPVWTQSDGSFKFYSPKMAGNAVIWVETIAGDKVSKNVQLTGNDINVTGLEICSDNEEGVITITPQGKSPITVPLPATTPAWIIDSSFVVYGETIGLNFIGYKPSVKVYNNASLFIPTPDGGMFSGENVQVEILEEKDNTIKISVSGNGTYMNSAYESVGAAATGTFRTTIEIKITMERNVTDWAKLSLPAAVPQMYTPIEMVYSVESVEDGAYKMLFYKDRTRTDYSGLKTKIAAAGYTVAVAEYTENDVTAVSYSKDNYYIMLLYSDQGIEDDYEEDTYKLVVYIWNNYTKAASLRYSSSNAIMRGKTALKSLSRNKP